MKVLCIKQDSVHAETKEKLSPLLIVGDDYTVYDIYRDEFYILEEFSKNEAFHMSLFATLDSNLDETTLVNHKPEPACQPF